MKMKKTAILTALVLLVVSTVFLSGCAVVNIPGVIKQVKRQSVSMDGISNLKIDLGYKNVTVLSNEGDTLEIRDYMISDNVKLHSTVSVSGDTITVSDAPGRANKTYKVEIAIPKTYKGTLSMSLIAGEVYAETDLTDYENIILNLQNGQMTMQKLEAKTISLNVGNGKIKTKSIKGMASCSVNSGTIAVSMDGLTADLTLDVERGTLDLTLPQDAAFHLKAKAERGTVKVTGTEEKIHVSGETVSKAIGMSPKHTIKASVGSGTINISVK